MSVPQFESEQTTKSKLKLKNKKIIKRSKKNKVEWDSSKKRRSMTMTERPFVMPKDKKFKLKSD